MVTIQFVPKSDWVWRDCALARLECGLASAASGWFYKYPYNLRTTENPRVGGSIPPLATKLSRPTLSGWAFCFGGCATPRGVRRRSACATPWRPGALKSPGSTLFCSQFSQNPGQLLRASTRRRPYPSTTCTCVTASGCPTCLD